MGAGRSLWQDAPHANRERPNVEASTLEEMAEELSVDPTEIEFLAEVDGDVSARLMNAIHEARKYQDKQLGDAFEGTLKLVPRPLRGKIRRVLFPEDDE